MAPTSASTGPKSSSRASSDSRSATSTMVGPSIAPASPPPPRPSSSTVAPCASAAAIAASARSRASGETIGQTSVPGSAPAPVVELLGGVAQRVAHLGLAASSPTITQTEPARQRCPAAPKAEPMIAGTALARSASSATIIEFLAPPSACTRLPVSAERVAISRAVLAWPTKRDRVDAVVVEDRLDRLAAAVHEVDDAGRKDLLLVDQLADPLGRARVPLRRLEDEGCCRRRPRRAGTRAGSSPGS